MKTTLFLMLTIFSIQITKADLPTIYLEIINANKEIVIKSHIIWNVDSTTQIPENYFSGNNSFVDKEFKLASNDIKITAFFPEQKSGRKLNASTTVLLSIYINGNKVIKSEYFGKISGQFVAYNTEVLCRPNLIKMSVNSKNSVNVLINGEYEYKHEDESFVFLDMLTINDKHIINDSIINSYVLNYGPIPKPIKYVEENLTVGDAGTMAIYSFKTKVNNLTEEYEYDWTNYTTIYTKKIPSYELTSLFNSFQQEYLTYENMVGLRIYDPVIHFFSNDIVFDKKKVKNVYDNRYTFTNLTDNMIVKSGIEILNPLKRKKLIVRFSNSWKIHSVIVHSELTKYSIEDNVVTIFNDGEKEMDYKIFASKKTDYISLRKKNSNDIIYYARPHIKEEYVKRKEINKESDFYGVFLKKGSYLCLLKCKKSNMKVDIYWNDFRIIKDYSVSTTYDNNIINIPVDINTKTIIIENTNDNEIKLNFDVMTSPGGDIKKYLKFTLKKGESIEIPFIF